MHSVLLVRMVNIESYRTHPNIRVSLGKSPGSHSTTQGRMGSSDTVPRKICDRKS